MASVSSSVSTTSYHLLTEQFQYDSLNRLKRVFDDGNTWRQEYIYDRYGNRTIDQTNTLGTGIPKPNFSVNTGANQLGVPNGQNGAMTYDSAGNLTTDTYSAAAVTRVYDAENRMTSETQANNYVAGSYSYDGDGQRVKRIVNGTETWQIYGLGGELVAEYAQNGSPSSPQKEYGYRNGQLLITATAGTSWGSPPTLHDNPLVVTVTTVQSRHITELRTAIDALRTHLGMLAYSWQQSATTNDLIKADPILEMRTALDQAIGAPSGGYSTDLAQGQPIKAVHIQELRDRVLAAWSSGSSTQVNWLVSDQLGTPRMIFDQSGSLATVSRHDYLPFGEELFAGIGGRTTALGYTNGDGARQKFTLKERDIETGLDYFGARYYASTQGRFTSADNIAFSKGTNPQNWNLYAYTSNNPLARVDEDGHDWFQVGEGYGARYEWHKGKKYTYTDAKGHKHNARDVGTHLLVFQFSKNSDGSIRRNSDGAALGTLTLYNQNKVAAQNPAAFTGGRAADGSQMNDMRPGVYTIRTDIRDHATAETGLTKAYGLQEIDRATGATGPWGTKRASLNEWDRNLPIEYRGNYLHGHQSARSTTAGCICDRPEGVLDAIFEINSTVTPVVKAVVTDGAPRRGDRRPGPYVIRP